MAVRTIQMIKGSNNVAITAQFIDVNSGDPMDFTGFVGATGYFPALDPQTPSIPIVGALQSNDLAEVVFTVPRASLDLMAEGEDMDWEQEVDLGTKDFVSQILGGLNILARKFPPA